MDYYKTDLKKVFSNLKTSNKGLSSSDAQARLDEYGYNRIESQKKVSPWVIFIQQFNDPVIFVLLAALIISFVVGYYEYSHGAISFLELLTEPLVIGLIVIANAFIGFKQEYNAEQAIEALKKMASLKAVVVRDGEETEIDAEQLVPGDIVTLTAGEKIPADCRVITLNNLQTQEAALTGESLPVKKEVATYKKEMQLGDRKNMLFSGTIITDGKATAIVVRTGMKTELGKIANLIETAEETVTPLQIKMDKLGKTLGIITLVICAVVFIFGVIRGDSILETFMTAVSLAVAAIPEGLPAVVTISLALGVKRMVKRNALVRRLPSVETLGSTTVICSDKTGTLTKNEMTVKKIFVDDMKIDVTGSGYEPEGTFSEHPKDLDLLLKIGLINNDSKLENSKEGFKIIGDPTEGALVVSAHKAGFNQLTILKENPRIDEVLFDSKRKRMATIQKVDGKLCSYVKGAPDIILNLCSKILVDGKIKTLDSKERKRILKINEEFASEALRVLGFAYRELKTKDSSKYEQDLVFVGLQGMIDPPRLEVKDSILKCKTAGIKVVMITGDYMGTAKAIAKELGIEGKAVDGKDIEKLNLSKEVEKIGIYARVDPEHKMNIVNALQKKGHIVAMTGDGVNDAPALKTSDIGISMGITGTDVAKEASDMILTDDNFSSIVNAVEEGRGVYDNIKKFFAFLVSGNIAEILIIFIAILLGWPVPLTATQILLINLITDGLPAVALGADPFEPNAMIRKPRKKDEKISDGINHYIIHYPIIVVTITLTLFYYVYTSTGNLIKAQTVAFLAISASELYQAYASRSLRYPSIKVGLFKNKYLILATIISMIITVGVIYVPFLRDNIFKTFKLTFSEFWFIIALSSVGFIYLEIYKYFKSKKSEGENETLNQKST